MTDALPEALSYAISILDNFSVNTFSILPSSSTTVNPGGQVSLAIPESSIVDFRSLRMYGDFVATGAGDAAAVPSTKVFARLPNASDFIQRFTTTINGVMVGGSCGAYNDATSLIALTQQDYSRSQSVEATLMNGNISSLGADQTKKLCLADWDSTIFGTSSCRAPHTGMLGSVLVNIVFADNSVLLPVGAAGIGGGLSAAELTASPLITYKINNLRFTVDCWSLGGNLYDQMLESRLMEAPIPIQYNELYSWTLENQTSANGTTRFSLATRCLNFLYGASRNGSYSAVGVDGKILAGLGNPFRSNRMRFRCFDAAETATYIWNVNNAQAPAFRADLTIMGANSAFSQTDMGNNNGAKGRGNSIYSLTDYNDGCAVVAQRYNAPGSGYGNEYRAATGLATKGVNMSGSFDIQGQQGIGAGDLSASQLVVASTSAVIMCGMGKQISVSF